MQKKQKTLLTKEKILEGSLKEFSTHSFNEASIRRMCEENKISKGLIYHNFKNKAQLYLLILDNIYKGLCEIIGEVDRNQDLENLINDYFIKRQSYFEKNPFYEKIFYLSLLNTPVELNNEIRILRNTHDRLISQLLESKMKNQIFAKDIDKEVATKYIKKFIEYFNIMFFSENREISIEQISLLHMKEIKRSLHILFYGLIRKE